LLEELKIAEEAEAFVAAGAVSRSFNNIQKNIASAPLETAWEKPHAMSQAAASSLLELEKKAAKSARLEAGGSNAQLAAEFGLTLVRYKVFACRWRGGRNVEPPRSTAAAS